MLLPEESNMGRRGPVVWHRINKPGEILTVLTCENIVINLVNQLSTSIYCILYDRLLYLKKIPKQIKARGTV